MSVLADTDVDRMTEVYSVCRDENVSLWVCVFLGSQVMLHGHISLEDAVIFFATHLLCPRQVADTAWGGRRCCCQPKAFLAPDPGGEGATLWGLSLAGWGGKEAAAVSCRLKCTSGTSAGRWVSVVSVVVWAYNPQWTDINRRGLTT